MRNHHFVAIFLSVACSVEASMPEAICMEDGSVDELVLQLRESDPNSQKTAADALRRLGPEAAAAVPSLVSAMCDRNQSVRYYAANCLGFIGPQAKSSIPTLSRLLSDSTEVKNVRAEVGRALGRIGPDALRDLLVLLQPGHDEVARSSAAHAIGMMGAKAQAAIPQLIDALSEGDYEIWYSAGESLVSIGSDALQPLQRAVESEDIRLRGRAGRALLKIEAAHLPTIRAMIASLKHPDAGLRTDAVYALESSARNAAAEVVPPLAEALHDEDDVVRELAARSLFGIGPQSQPAILDLIKTLQDPEHAVRGFSALALGKIGVGSEMIVDALSHGIKDEDGDVRICITRALGQLGPAAASSVPKLEAVLGEADLDGELRQAVEKSLSQILKR